jgi:hypothetical protein
VQGMRESLGQRALRRNGDEIKTKIHKRQDKDEHLLKPPHLSASNAQNMQASKTQTLGQRRSLPQSNNPCVQMQMVLFIFFFTANDDAIHLSINNLYLSYIIK